MFSTQREKDDILRMANTDGWAHIEGYINSIITLNTNTLIKAVPTDVATIARAQARVEVLSGLLNIVHKHASPLNGEKD